MICLGDGGGGHDGHRMCMWSCQLSFSAVVSFLFVLFPVGFAGIFFLVSPFSPGDSFC